MRAQCPQRRGWTTSERASSHHPLRRPGQSSLRTSQQEPRSRQAPLSIRGCRGQEEGVASIQRAFVTLLGIRPSMDQIDRIFVAVEANRAHGSSLIGCLYTGSTLPPHCIPMPRRPEPATGIAVDASFPSILLQALAVNPAVHDGAILIGRKRSTDAYRIAGWSYRLVPPPGPAESEPNRGSAFNSCLAMSSVETIDRIYLISADGVFRFRHGCVSKLTQRGDGGLTY